MDEKEVEKLEQRFMKLTNLVNNSFTVDHSVFQELKEIEKKLHKHYANAPDNR